MEPDMVCMGCLSEKDNSMKCSRCGWLEGTAPESAMHLPPRTILNGKYMLGRVLGQGGFGITYLAWDIVLDRKLAVKEYFPRELASRTAVDTSVQAHSDLLGEQYNYGLDKFLDEAKTLAKFDSHPNVISVKDFFQSNGTAYLVMNYLEGCTLKDYLSDKGCVLTYEDALGIFLPVLNALEAIHWQGMLHRDVSPDNIFITSEGGVILLDFGAARHALVEKGKNLSIILKPGFAPEEQYRSKGIQGSWTDIYAVAASFYLVTCGIMPPDSLDRLVEDHLIPPSQMGITISPAGEKALLQALAVKAEHRFQNVEEFRNALWSGSFCHDNEQTTDSGNDYTHSQVETGYDQLDMPAKQLDSGKVSVKLHVGRHETNNIIIADPSVSRYHASVLCLAGSWYIQDLNSSEGTFHNNHRIYEPEELISGSRILIGNTLLIFNGSDFLTEDGRIYYSLNQNSYSFRVAESFIQADIGKNGSVNDSEVRKPFILVGLIAVLVIAGITFSLTYLTGNNSVAREGAPEQKAIIKSESTGSVSADTVKVTLEFGTIEYQNGTYTGQLKGDLPHGEGTWVYKISGKSLSFSPIGSTGEQRYEGEWVNGKKHGKGKMVMPTGVVQSGIWENDNYLGPGGS